MNEESSNRNNKGNKVNYLFAAFIAFITYLVYIPSLQNKFLDWDDGMYVYTNFFIRSFDSMFFKHAFLRFQASNWHPLTWFSHAVDYALWGLNPLGHHLTNNILHGMNTFLVVLLVLKLLNSARTMQTGAGRFSDAGIFVAAGITGLLFGLHPVHVESVAWISERKDVLCAFFYLLGLVAYINYVNKAGRVNSRGRFLTGFFNRYYRWTLVLFILSLMSKPMAVMFPVVLLILDWYPFARFKERGKISVLMEKLPFFVLSLGSAIITILAQRFGGALKSTMMFPLPARILVGLKAPIDYLAKMIYPVNLSPYYPHPHPEQTVLLFSYKYLIPLCLMAGITTACVILLKKQKVWSAVWGYYLVTLLPVLGILQVGSQAVADRYTYLPSIGPFLLIGLGAAMITDRRYLSGRFNSASRLTCLFIAVLLFGVLSYATVMQIRVWKNPETLWNRVISIYPDVSLAYNNRGVYYRNTGQYDKAVSDFTKGLSITPGKLLLYTNRARTYSKLGRFEDALNDTEEAIRLDPEGWKAYEVRARIFTRLARYEEARRDYSEVIRLTPRMSEAYNNRANIYLRLGSLEKAVNDYEQAIRLSPLPEAAHYYNLAIAYRMLNRPEDALNSFMKYQEIRKNP